MASKETLLRVQKEQLKNWEKLLKPEIFQILKMKVEISNESEEVKKDFWKIKRGVDFYMIINNEILPNIKD